MEQLNFTQATYGSFLRSARGVWNLDLNAFNARFPDHILAVTIWDLILANDIDTRLNLDMEALASFLFALETHYLPSAYHNRLHATHVAHAMNCLMINGGILESLKRQHQQDDTECAAVMLAALIGAAVHDLGHLGVNNNFLREAKHSLARDHKDSPMERHHINKAQDLCGRPGNNFLHGAPAHLSEQMWSRVSSMVLATDMGRHAEELERAKGLLDPPYARRVPGQPMPDESDDMISRTLSLTLKCSDLAHTAETWESHQTWVQLLEDELRLQARCEAGLHIVSSTPPAATNGEVGWMLASQEGFMKSVVLPMFALLSEVYPKCRWIHSAAGTNTRKSMDLASGARPIL